MARRGENIYKRKDGRWEARYIKNRDSNGKAVYGYIYSKTYNEVKDKLTKAKLNSTINAETETMPKRLAEFASDWLDTTTHYCKRSTYVKYRNIVNKHIIPTLGNLSLFNLDTKTINEFCQEKLFSCNLSPKSVRDILSVIKLIFKFANNMGVMCNCDFSAISIKASKKTIFGLSRVQTRQLTDFLMHNIDHVNIGILIALFTGIRLGELCALKYDDLNLEGKVIRIDKTMQRIQNFNNKTNKTDVIVSSPKSDCSVREIPLPNFIANIIIENNLYKKNAYVLTGTKDKYVEPRTLQNKFNKIASFCGIDDVTFHMIRHTFASTCIEAGVDIKSLSEILGHSSVNITLNRYVHSSMEIKKMNIEKLYSFSIAVSNLVT